MSNKPECSLEERITQLLEEDFEMGSNKLFEQLILDGFKVKKHEVRALKNKIVAKATIRPSKLKDHFQQKSEDTHDDQYISIIGDRCPEKQRIFCVPNVLANKEKGNDAFKKKDYDAALSFYSVALSQINCDSVDGCEEVHLWQLYSNLSAAKMKTGALYEALQDAISSNACAPDEEEKPILRCAEALAAMGLFHEANELLLCASQSKSFSMYSERFLRKSEQLSPKATYKVGGDDCNFKTISEALRFASAGSDTTIVSQIGKSEREEIQKFLALARHRKFSEHIEYGGAFVRSWAGMSAGRIVAMDLTGDWAAQEREHIRRGNFDDEGIRVLRELQNACPKLPVLALHVYDGIRGLWHCINNGAAYTVSLAIDLTTINTDGIQHVMEDGNQVILALQGYADRGWWDTMPHADEIKAYQDRQYHDGMPNIVKGVESENMTSGAATTVSCATVIEMNGEEQLIYYAPEIRTTPDRDPELLNHLPFLRAKVIASLSSAGYWHSTLRGVAFRAYLKGAWCSETIWTGGVLGWRQSSTSAPNYYTPTHQVIGVRAILVLGGYNNVDQVSKYNPDIFCPGYKAVCESNTQTYEKAIPVGYELIDLILNCNAGQRYHLGNDSSTFLNFVANHPLMREQDIPPYEAKELLKSALEDGAMQPRAF